MEIEIAEHHTPGIERPLKVLSMAAPYDANKAHNIGPAPFTYFDRATNTWRVPVYASPETIGQILRIWNLVALPDGTVLRSRT